jgi:hypothetical protein
MKAIIMTEYNRMLSVMMISHGLLITGKKHVLKKQSITLKTIVSPVQRAGK